MEEQIKEKRVADSLTEQFHEIRPEHLNGADVMFGGILMGWIDEVAGLTAMRHSEGHVLTASHTLHQPGQLPYPAGNDR